MKALNIEFIELKYSRSMEEAHSHPQVRRVWSRFQETPAPIEEI
jgi:hypothetical protein